MSINDLKETEKDSVRHLDIRGRVCPLTFVYTKLELEELSKGDILEVLLDFPAALKNIPENCKRQSLAKLLEIEELDSKKEVWILRLKKL
ncbi:MAG: sulfurtransferase TusA family protein [Candidatus Hodarchaeota archaeon]